MTTDHAAVEDLRQFALLEVESGDLEPWADLLGHMYRIGDLDQEETLWLIKAYNAYDDLGSAWSLVSRWPSPRAWAEADDQDAAADYPCTQERRNLRGGRILRHLESYAEAVGFGAQTTWIMRGLNGVPEGPAFGFDGLVKHLRTIWGTGRQSAFEWAEFLAKAMDVPVVAGHGHFWESEGPRRSLERIAGCKAGTPEELNAIAIWLYQELGLALSWEDFETVVCDFNVMRDGRYYPGRHLAALREEIDGLPAMVSQAWLATVPEPWSRIAPGIDKSKLAVYRDTGRMVTAP